MQSKKEIVVDPGSLLFDRTGMFFKEFPSDYRQIRYFTLLVLQKAPSEIKEINLLEQQISEIIKNAVKHGNRMDRSKKIRIWFSFTITEARLIVQDEGEGFKDLEKWNEFNRKRLECFEKRDFEEMASFVSFRTDRSDETDGGNALFAALEYWNSGLVFDDKRTCVAVKKIFPRRSLGIDMEGKAG